MTAHRSSTPAARRARPRSTSERLLETILVVRDVLSMLEGLEHLECTEERLAMGGLADEFTRLLHEHREIDAGGGTLNVAVIGDFSSGKSSFINSLIGSAVCPVAVWPTTSAVSSFRWGDTLRIIRRTEERNSTELTLEEYSADVTRPRPDDADDRPVLEFDVALPLDLLRDLTLIDTPGFHNSESSRDAELTKRKAMKSDVIIYVADIERGELGADTVATIQEIKAQTRHEIPWLLVLNCVDRKPPGARQRIKESIMQKHGPLFSGEPWLYSATWALQANERAESSWLNLVKSEILRAAALRTSRELTLRCSPTATGGFMLSVGDESRLVRAGLEKDVTSAETMLQNLRLLARNKRRLLRGRFLEEWEAANQALGELSQRLTSRLSAHETGDVDIAQDRIADVLLQSLLDCGASQTVRYLIACGLTTRELTKEECDYWATPYATIEFSFEKVEQRLAKDLQMSVEECLRKAFSTAGLMHEEIAAGFLFSKEKEEDLKLCETVFVNGMLEGLAIAARGISFPVYEDIEEARANRKALSAALKATPSSDSADSADELHAVLPILAEMGTEAVQQVHSALVDLVVHYLELVDGERDAVAGLIERLAHLKSQIRFRETPRPAHSVP